MPDLIRHPECIENTGFRLKNCRNDKLKKPLYGQTLFKTCQKHHLTAGLRKGHPTNKQLSCCYIARSLFVSQARKLLLMAPTSRRRRERKYSLKYRIEYSPETEAHFRALTTRQQVTILDAVEKLLQDQPGVETRNRKPMRPNPVAPWELRTGNLRVYYDIEHDPEYVVYIRAVGIKDRNSVRIGKEVIKL